MNHPISIEVLSDVVCPWCYIGKRHLEAAITQWQATNPHEPAPNVMFRPFQLNPELVATGMPRDEYMMAKFGSNQGGQIYARVISAAANVGLDLKLDKIARQPNTLKAHALLMMSVKENNQAALNEALFKAYFIDGKDLTQDDVLREIALGAGMSAEQVDAALTEPRLHQAITEEDQRARQAGISRVPLFIIDKQIPVSGAQGAGVLLHAMNQIQAQRQQNQQ